jgi:bifunctional non-homologous end joining protein LigD
VQDRSAPGLTIGGRDVRLTNLSKVLWPEVGLRKADLVDYYVRVSDVLLPHIAGHPLTLHRFPDGVEGSHWYETRAPAHPPWVRTQAMGFRSGKDVRAPVVDDLASLVWAANAGAIELHPFLAPADDLDHPRGVVFDLDPGPGVDVAAVCAVAIAVRRTLEDEGVDALVKVSGVKGLHVWVPLDGSSTYDETKAFARGVAARLAAASPDRITDRMPRVHREGRVFIDWSQNDPGKSTVAPYSLRGLIRPTVSAPVRWDEVEAVARGGDPRALVVLLDEVFVRLDADGDLWAPVSSGQRLPA